MRIRTMGPSRAIRRRYLVLLKVVEVNIGPRYGKGIRSSKASLACSAALKQIPVNLMAKRLGFICM